MSSDRLDKLLVERKAIKTRSRAADFIRRGLVKVDDQVVLKPSFLVSETAHISIEQSDAHYVSRGALKLKAALAHFDYDITGDVALDLGASTGGFTQVLLEQGVEKVYAVDVGHNQLHDDIKKNSKVISLEKQDGRGLNRKIIQEPIDLIVVDVSFISLLKVLKAPLELMKQQAKLIALIKPQFEVGKEGLGKGGVVRDEELRQEAVLTVRNWMEARPDWHVDGVLCSPIAGGSGNQEYLLGAQTVQR